MNFFLGAECMSLLLLVMTSFLYFPQKRLRGDATSLFSALFLYAYIDIISDILLSLWYYTGAEWEQYFYEGLCFLRAFTSLSFLVILASYTIHLTFGANMTVRPIFYVLVTIPAVISELVILYRMITGDIIYLVVGDYPMIEDVVYNLVFWNYLLYIALIFVLSFINSGIIDKRTAIFVKVITFLQLVVLYKADSFGYMIDCILIPIIIFCLYAMVHFPRFCVDFMTNLFNQQAFLISINERILTKKSFKIISINFSNFREDIDRDNIYFSEFALRTIAGYMPKPNKKVECFRTGRSSFAMICSTEKEFLYWLEILKDIQLSPEKYPDIASEITFHVSTFEYEPEYNLNKFEVIRVLDRGLELSTNNNVAEVLNLNNTLDILKREQAVVAAINKAIKFDGFDVYFQPVYNTRTGAFDKAEALVRLWDPDLGFIPPDEFIRLAEDSNQVFDIDMQVLSKVCKFFKEEDFPSYGITAININLSVLDLIHPELEDYLIRQVVKNGLEPENIILEVTETTTTNSSRAILPKVERLSKKGYAFAIDDYGTGYSSIERILSLPLRYIKIDKSVLYMSEKDKKRDLIFSKNVDLLRQCGYKIVVEGAETADQVEKLHSLMVDYIQGYYYSKPLPLEEYLAFLKEHNNEN